MHDHRVDEAREEGDVRGVGRERAPLRDGAADDQFHGANQQVKDLPDFPPGEEPTLSRYFTSHWSDAYFCGKFVWSHRFQNMLIMVGFIVFFRFATFYALERINYSTR